MEKYHQMLKRMELTEELKTKKLSTGMMAKLKIAVTMARNAKLYLLDEPLNGIDLLARDEIMKSILEVIDPDVTLVQWRRKSYLSQSLRSLVQTSTRVEEVS